MYMLLHIKYTFLFRVRTGELAMKGIIFDLDGVIIHTDHYHYLAWKKVCDMYQLEFDTLLNNQLRGVSRMESLDIILSYNKKVFSSELKDHIANLKNEFYKTYLSELTQNDLDIDTKKTLQVLKDRGYKLAIGSSSRNAKFILINIGLLDFFDVISDGTNISKSKPDPEVFIKAATWLNLQYDECAVVEDAVAGLEAAKSGGMIAIGMGDAAYHKLADYSLNFFSDLLSIFK